MVAAMECGAPLYALDTNLWSALMAVDLLKSNSRATCNQAAALNIWDN